MPKTPKNKPVKMKAISIDVWPDEHERMMHTAKTARISTAEAYRMAARSWMRRAQETQR